MSSEFDQLVDAIADAARKTFLDLFSNGETFYYAGLNIFEGVCPPTACAWSYEALERVAPSDRPWLKWSYADSPYDCFKHEEYFAEVDRLFFARPDLWEMGEADFYAELTLRAETMVAAMARLDAEGLFALNQPRADIVINVESQPPDAMNLGHARRLNPPEALTVWLHEADTGEVASAEEPHA
ncbi:MAG: DUF4303 domain-containing protein [Micrococcales bacterium]|nr:DUF4303 domain-containing protein [Micrococcales bacterium]